MLKMRSCRVTKAGAALAMSQLLIASFATGLLLFASCGGARAEGEGLLFLPLVLSKGAPEVGVMPAPTPPPVAWSLVLERVPLHPDARLELYRVHTQVSPPEAVALYSIAAAPYDEVLAWYRQQLAARGWRLVEDRPGGQRWVHYDGWLEVSYRQGFDQVERLRLARPRGAASAPNGVALDPSVPLPNDVVRWRYDRTDLLTEEFHIARPVETARVELADALARASWVGGEAVCLGETVLTSYSRGDERLLTSVRPVSGGVSEIGVGRGSCLPESELPGARAESVYLHGVPAPPGMRIAGYERRPVSRDATERWHGECVDLDLFAAAFLERLSGSGWSPVIGGRLGGEALHDPAALYLELASREGGPLLWVAARPAGGGAAVVTLQAPDGVRSVTEGSSLLFDDLPLPDSADALRLERDLPEGWDFRERYTVPGGTVDGLGAWFQRQMTVAGWTFERLEPPVSGPDQAYFSGGEEVLVGFEVHTDATVALSRRRICPSGLPVRPPPEGEPARRLREVPVYPGAAYEGFDAPIERYRVECAGLALVVDWYHAAMERGNWKLAAIEGPEDPIERRLEFARPDELSLPPEERTAWAEVHVVRAWPYQYVLDLRRDAAGIIPGLSDQ